jgi:GNAT superfamily N-acetyltransferase
MVSSLCRQDMAGGRILKYRPMMPGEEDDVCRLVNRVFQTFVAPQYSQEGVAQFLGYSQPEAMAARTRANHFVLVAQTDGTLVGAIEIRHCSHISLLFVDGRFQKQGIARELIRRALELCTGDLADPNTMTVNSSPNAVSAYQRLGFQLSGPEQTVNGIRFVPMALSIPAGDSQRNRRPLDASAN